MPRYAARVDANLTQITAAYRKLGCKVRVTNDDTCDLIVQYGGLSDLVEAKDGSKPPSKRKLTPNQERVHEVFMIRIVKNMEEVAEHVAALRRKSNCLAQHMGTQTDRTEPRKAIFGGEG